MADDSSAVPGEFAAVVRRAWAHSLDGGLFSDDDDFFDCGGAWSPSPKPTYASRT